MADIGNNNAHSVWQRKHCDRGYAYVINVYVCLNIDIMPLITSQVLSTSSWSMLLLLETVALLVADDSEDSGANSPQQQQHGPQQGQGAQPMPQAPLFQVYGMSVVTCILCPGSNAQMLNRWDTWAVEPRQSLQVTTDMP